MLFRQAGSLIAAAVTLWAGVLAAGPAQARWLKAETDQFVVYSDVNERDLREYAANLQVFDSLLRLRHGQPVGRPALRKLPVYLVGDIRDLRRAQPEAPDSMAGIYLSSDNDIYAVAIRTHGDDVLLHEYVHHFMLAEFPTAYPTWLLEGYAEYFASAEFKPQELNFGKPNPNRSTWLIRGDWMKLADVLRRRPSELKTSEQRSMYYAQAWLLTHFMVSDARRLGQLQAYAKAVSGGQDPVAAMEAATGAPIDVLERALRSYLNGGIKYGRLPRDRVPAPKVTVSPMPASADDLLLEGQLLKRRPPEASRRELLNKVRTRAAKHPGDRLAEITLARAETTIGDRAAGEAILTRRVAADPKDVEALRLLAESRRAAAEAETDDKRAAEMRTEARRHAARAMNVDQSEYQTLLVFVRSRMGLPAFPTGDDLAALLLAHGQAPQLDWIRVTAAQILLKQGQVAGAARLLQPVVNDPHGGKGAAAAKALLDAAVKARPITPSKAAPAASPR